jgi:hypothetical protein
VSYYGAGDYYAAGDPGLFDVFKKVVKIGAGIGKAVLGATPVGVAAGVVSRALTPTGPAMVPTIRTPDPMSFGAVPSVTPGAYGAGAGAERVVVGRARNVLINGKRYHYNKYGELKKGRIPIMNPLNPRALSRSSTRIDRMRKGMTKALRHTNYKMVTKGTGRRGGSRGVITRSEAARALRG